MSFEVLALVGGAGLPVPCRRTFATGLVPFAHSRETALRHPGFACFPRRRHGTGNPSRIPPRREWTVGSEVMIRGRLSPMTSSEDFDDATLARRAGAGCVESFAELATRYQVRVIRYVRKFFGESGSEADDVAQDAFVRAWQAIATYDDRWAFSTWVFTIAHRTCLNHQRAARRRRRRETVVAPVTFATPDPYQAAVATERAASLWDVAAETLSERQFTAVWLRYAEAKSLAEIAAVLGTSESNAKLIVFRARRRLAPLVRDLVD